MLFFLEINTTQIYGYNEAVSNWWLLRFWDSGYVW